MIVDHLASPAVAGFSASTIRDQARNADAAAGRPGDWRRASERLESTSVDESGAVVTDLGQHAGAGDVAETDERWSTDAVPPGGWAVIRAARPSAGPARPVPGTVCPDPVAD